VIVVFEGDWIALSLKATPFYEEYKNQVFVIVQHMVSSEMVVMMMMMRMMMINKRHIRTPHTWG